MDITQYPKYVTAFRIRLRSIKHKLKWLIIKSWNRATKKSKIGKPFPSEVNIGARMFTIQEHEGIITFSAQDDYLFYGCHERVSFTHPKYAQWHMEYSTTFGKIRPSFVLDCYRIVCEYRGDDYGRDLAIDGHL